MNEAETRAELIDPKLKACGWGVVSPKDELIVKEKTCNNSMYYNRIEHICLTSLQNYMLKNLDFSINGLNFVHNKTHHASHLNSAPGWVFDLYGGYVS